MDSLVVPPEIKRDINKYSGYISPGSRFYQKNLKGLFFTKENTNYLDRELYQLITCEDYIKDNLLDSEFGYKDGEPRLPNRNGDLKHFSRDNSKSKRIIQTFIGRRNYISKIIVSFMEDHPLPFIEDLDVQNPVMQLHSVNLDFLVKTSSNLIQSPENLVSRFNAINPDTNKYEETNWDYSAESYSDGTWHPEHLFTNCQRNRDNPYWIPLEVNIYSDPDAKGVGHKYNDIIYNRGTKEYYQSDIAYDGSKKGGISKKASNLSYGQFPGWQTTVNKRFYDRENTDGLKDGGLNDRRVQRPHGYDMSALRKK